MSLQFILYTTGQCNLTCDYCGGSFDPRIVPWKVEYDVDLLEGLVKSGDVIAFYGGEPLLNIPFIRRIVESFPDVRFVVQSNGLLLDKLDTWLLESFSTILVSLDGPGSVTDKHRGQGVYARVLKEVEAIRSKGFSGDIVARMTLTGDSDVFRDVMHLLSLELFDHVHWQLGFIWMPRESWSDLWSWIRGSYLPGLRRLFNKWVLELDHRVLGIAPFQGVLKRILQGGPCPPCGSGVESFTVLTDGRIVSCPIAVSENWAMIGRVDELSRRDLECRKPLVNEPCRSCRYLKVCGTRCLYTHVERLWGEEGFRAVCECSMEIINLVEGEMETILESAAKNGLRPEDLYYPDYNNTVEIIP
ncbi:MAG: TIGR04084 family radical SAM/SPASM domain-containing protein [Thermoproteota archaeon]